MNKIVMKIQLKRKNKSYKDISTDKEYYVIGIEADDFRILSDEGIPYLYPHNLFTIVDESECSDWQTEYDADGARYSYSPELGSVGFFEDYFDGNEEAVKIFNEYLKKRFLL